MRWSIDDDLAYTTEPGDLNWTYRPNHRRSTGLSVIFIDNLTLGRCGSGHSGPSLWVICGQCAQPRSISKLPRAHKCQLLRFIRNLSRS